MMMRRAAREMEKKGPGERENESVVELATQEVWGSDALSAAQTKTPRESNDLTRNSKG